MKRKIVKQIGISNEIKKLRKDSQSLGGLIPDAHLMVVFTDRVDSERLKRIYDILAGPRAFRPDFTDIHPKFRLEK